MLSPKDPTEAPKIAHPTNQNSPNRGYAEKYPGWTPEPSRPPPPAPTHPTGPGPGPGHGPDPGPGTDMYPKPTAPKPDTPDGDSISDP